MCFLALLQLGVLSVILVQRGCKYLSWFEPFIALAVSCDCISENILVICPLWPPVFLSPSVLFLIYSK
jgi:hypothetical protein